MIYDDDDMEQTCQRLWKTPLMRNECFKEINKNTAEHGNPQGTVGLWHCSDNNFVNHSYLFKREKIKKI